MSFPPTKSLVAASCLAVSMLLVPSTSQADTCTLGAAPTSCTFTNTPLASGNLAIFTTDATHPTGTGFIDSFVRIQQNGWEQGYNTSARPTQFNEKTDPNYTRNLLLTEVGTVTENGILYREFFLDVNEPGATNYDKNWITLDQLEIYVSNTASLNYYTGNANDGLVPDAGCLGTASDGAGGCVGAATKIYDLDGYKAPNKSYDNQIDINYLVSSGGSGTGDMRFLLADSLFKVNGVYQSYVYLFSQFGDLPGDGKTAYQSQAGFEEWFVKNGTGSGTSSSGGGSSGQTPVPEPASLLLLGSGLAVAYRRRRKQTAA